jgi:hypothetical protein
MRFQFLALLLMTIAAAGTFWYRTTASICPAPLSYRLGTIAPEFNLSEDKAREYLKGAESVWESAVDEDLFYYDPKGTVVVNFIFDERQAMADSQSAQKTALDAKKAENEKVITALEELQRDYEAQSKTYQDKLRAYETRLNEYNERVNRYNDQGGAPENEYQKLEAEKLSLGRESNSLDSTADSLNSLASKINELSQKSGQLIDAYNAEVQSYNEQFGFSREFTEGDYQNSTINIYKFSGESEVTKVLAHELGHALGIDHVEGKSSVMYYLIGDTNQTPSLSKEDIEAYTVECGTGDERLSKVRRLIREFIQHIKYS